MQQLTMVSLVVPDYDEAISYYTQKLDFENPVEDTDLGDGKRWVVVAPGSATRLLLARAKTRGKSMQSVIKREAEFSYSCIPAT